MTLSFGLVYASYMPEWQAAHSPDFLAPFFVSKDAAVANEA